MGRSPSSPTPGTPEPPASRREARLAGGPAARPAPRALAPRILSTARVALFWLGVGALFFFVELYIWLVLCVPYALSGRRAERYWVRGWNDLVSFWGTTVHGLLRALGGLRLDVEGSVPPGRHIVVANHQSTADIILLFYALRSKNLKFVAKKQLSRLVPNVSPALRMAGFGLVDFGDRSATVKSLMEFARSLERWDGSPVLYPEGVRSFDGSISRFHPAGIRLLVNETGLPILPVVLDGLWQARTVREFFRHLPGSRARLRILPAIPSAEAIADLEGFPKRLETRMLEELDRMRREVPRQVAP